MTEEEARRALTRGLSAGAAALLMWSLVGFGFAYGGLGLWMEEPGFAALRRVYTLGADPQPLWSLVGLSGFLLQGVEGSPEAATLWAHAALGVLCAALLLGVGMEGFSPRIAAAAGAWLGGFLLPLGIHWVWGNGWLSRLGLTLNLGHGVVDPAGVGVLFALAGGALLGLLLPGGRRVPQSESSFPPVHLPLLGGWACLWLGGGWLAWLRADPLAAARPALEGALLARNAALAAMGAAFGAGLYTAFVAREVDPLMLIRAVAVGWIAGMAAAPFTGPWQATGWGILVGLATPGIVYLLRREGMAVQSLALLYGVAGILGLLAVGVLADGRAGVGWNEVGKSAFMGHPGLGVVGVPGWGQPADPGQLTAQAVGALVLSLWGFLGTGGPAALLRWGWRRWTLRRGRLPASEETSESSG
jgi:Amt family ammonium transporter